MHLDKTIEEKIISLEFYDFETTNIYANVSTIIEFQRQRTSRWRSN